MQLPKGGRRWNRSSAEAALAEHASAEPWGRCIPVVQLVGPEMTKEELLELYLEVYKLHRLPGSPPGELAILKEVLSSLPDHQRCEEEKASAAMAWPHPEGSHSSRSSAPPTEEGKMTQWKEVWPRYVRPIKKHWPCSGYPGGGNREAESHPGTIHSWGLDPRVGTTNDESREGQKRRHCKRFGSKINLPPATLPTPKQNLVSRGPRAKALTWRSCTGTEARW